MIRKSGNRSRGKTTLNWNSDGARVSNEALRIGWKKLIIVMAAPLGQSRAGAMKREAEEPA
jgi:hypothetical protein